MARISSKGMKSWRDLEKIVRSISTDLDALAVLVNELRTDHGTALIWDTESEADQDAIANYNHFMNEADGVIGGDYAFSATAAPTLTGAGYVKFRLDGQIYHFPLDTTITLEDNAGAADIADGKKGSWRILMDKLGAVTTQKAADNQQFTAAEDSMLNLSNVAQTADTVCIGYLTIATAGAVFNIGTTDLNAGTATCTMYYERGNRKQITGLHAALGSETVATPGANTVNIGTIDAKIQGVNVAQIAANATDAIDDADIISTLKWGAWVFVTDLAGTATFALAADGVAGTASTMAYASETALDAALVTLFDNLPSVFCPICVVKVYNKSAGDFTGATTNWDAADMVTTVVDCTVGKWDRTNLSGVDTHRINPPTLPENIVAPLVTAITAPEISLQTSQT